ncbi:MAG: MurR/RpiR family transcriptional regulator [Erysipelotrichaceae bacterium]|nr:MurR/RpiR family transcriptional regulator [Erysipelotrichaceae bacterium]MDY5252767.1 MurR/RpiR family transcriptional regulator [Erysipelotrichaceae bacterium]
MTPLQHIYLHKDEFTKSELIIMDFVLNNLREIVKYPIATISEKCNVSKSALLRFCQKCGFRGYSEFRYEVSRYLQSSFETNKSSNIDSFIDLYTTQIKQLSASFKSKNLDEFSLLIKKATKIRILGVHETGLAALYFSYRLTSLGIDAEAITDTSIFTDKINISKPSDLNIFLSLSAETTVIKDSIILSKECNASSILITQNDHHKFKNKVNTYFILPTFNFVENKFFVDSQALVFIGIDILINNLANTLIKDNKKSH